MRGNNGGSLAKALRVLVWSLTRDFMKAHLRCLHMSRCIFVNTCWSSLQAEGFECVWLPPWSPDATEMAQCILQLPNFSVIIGFEELGTDEYLKSMRYLKEKGTLVSFRRRWEKTVIMTSPSLCSYHSARLFGYQTWRFAIHGANVALRSETWFV